MTSGARAGLSPTPGNLDAMQQCLDLVRHVLEFDDGKASCTGVNTISVFGGHYRVDLAEGYPLLTTMQRCWRSMRHEPRWYLSGEDHIGTLRQTTRAGGEGGTGILPY